MSSRHLATTGERRLEHSALLYVSLDEFLASLVPFVQSGIDRGEPMFVAVGARELAALRDEFDEAEGLTLEDTRSWHPHPSSRLRAFNDFVAECLARGAPGVRLVGEPVWPERPPEEVREWQRYESVLNAVLDPLPVSLVCTYDSSRLDDAILEGARFTHRVVQDGVAAPRPSEQFVEPAELLVQLHPELAEPPENASFLADPQSLAAGRRFVEAQAVRAGLGPERTGDLALAANEVLTNAIAHGGGASRMSAWTVDGRLLCQIEDGGPGVADPFVGYLPPSAEGNSGRGLWLARQLVDLLELGPGIVRLHMTLHADRSIIAV